MIHNFLTCASTLALSINVRESAISPLIAQAENNKTLSCLSYIKMLYHLLLRYPEALFIHC